jgi:hypothetical protein
MSRPLSSVNWFDPCKSGSTTIRRAFHNANPQALAISADRRRGGGRSCDEDEVFRIVHRVHDAVIANAHAEVIPPGKLH